MSVEQVQELAALAERAKTAAEAQDLDRFFESHLGFRRKIWELSGNKYLQQSLERVVIPLYALYFIRRSSKREGILHTVTDCIQHQDKVIDALRSRDFKTAEQSAREFLERMKEYLKIALPPSNQE